MTMHYLYETCPAFVEAIKTVENNIHSAKKREEYKQVTIGSNSENTPAEWRWFPGRSPEGGLPTVAWGHKITPREWEQKKIYYIDAKLNQMVYKDFRYGLTDQEAHQVLLGDLRTAEDLASNDWDRYIGHDQKKPWVSLPDKYKGVLVNLVFNTGPLVKKGKWIWSTVARGVQLNDDAIVIKGMVTSYKRPDGTRVQLTSRAVEIGKALGLPWQILEKT